MVSWITVKIVKKWHSLINHLCPLMKEVTQGHGSMLSAVLLDCFYSICFLICLTTCNNLEKAPIPATTIPSVVGSGVQATDLEQWLLLVRQEEDHRMKAIK